MKKNIIVAGTARAGKSTLSSMLSKQIGYQHIAMDAIIEGFEDIFPEIGIDTHTDSITNISKKVAPFINAILKSGEYDKFTYGLVIDVCQLMPEDFMTYIDRDICDIYYLITECDSAEERLSILKEFDDEEEYTFAKPDNEKLLLCKDLIEESKLFREQCQVHDLPCVDTLYDRENTLNEMLHRISGS